MHHRGRERSSRRGDRHLRAVPDDGLPPAPAEFLTGIREALDDPAAFLSLVSAMVSVFDRRTDLSLEDDDGGPDLPRFLESVIGYESRETTALLLALAELVTDNRIAQQARRAAGRHPHDMPGWLAQLAEVEPGPAAASVDVLGDGENAVVSVRLADGQWLTGVVYIDHNLGTVAKDGFLIPDSVDGFRRQFLKLTEDPAAISFQETAPAEARARIVQAIERGTHMVPPRETDTWPACRPLIEWMVSLLPSGGTGFAREELTLEEQDRTVEEFLRSPHGIALIGPDDAEIAADLLHFTADYTGGDPWRWSPWNVRYLLTEWYPGKISADLRYLLRMPVVLRALVPYVHEQKRIPPYLTTDTLAAIDEWEPVFLSHLAQRTEDEEQIELSDRRLSLVDDHFEALLAQERRDRAVELAGGEQALAALDDAPLPDEPFAWQGIAEDIHDRVAGVLELCDACADEHFDGEMRTAFRRVLARTARVEPAVFRRRSKDSTLAAAIAWAVGTVNEEVGPYSGRLTAKELLAHFGVSGTVSQRATPLLRAFGTNEHAATTELTFGTPDVLTSRRRSELIAARDDAR